MLCSLPPESFKIQYLQFLDYTKTPQYKANLQKLLDQEKVCRLFLLSVVRVEFSWWALGHLPLSSPVGEEHTAAGHSAAALWPLPGPEGRDPQAVPAEAG